MLGEACWREERLVTLLRELGATPLLVPELRGVRCSGRRYGPDSRPLAWNASSSYFDATYTILAAWNLTQYRAVLVLDSDLALRQSLDHVLLAMLARPEIAEARTPEGCLDAVSVGPLRGNYFNTGVWGVRPDAHVWAALVRWLQSGTREHQCGIGIQTAAKGFFSATRIDPWRLDPPKDCCQEWREMNDVDRAGNHRRRPPHRAPPPPQLLLPPAAAPPPPPLTELRRRLAEASNGDSASASHPAAAAANSSDAGGGRGGRHKGGGGGKGFGEGGSGGRGPARVKIPPSPPGFTVRVEPKLRPWEILQLHAGYNIKANRGVVDCLRRHRQNSSDVFVVHWSGSRKPLGLKAHETRDELERSAHAEYVGAYCALWERAYSSSVPEKRMVCFPVLRSRIANPPSARELSLFSGGRSQERSVRTSRARASEANK